jgi:hypothetical protein
MSKEACVKVKCSLVLTTIFDPIILEDYFQNFKRYGHLEEVEVYVIPDRKTPSVPYECCAKLQKQGLRVICPALDEQEDFLRKVGFQPNLIPYDSDNRRNVGYLMAIAWGGAPVI